MNKSNYLTSFVLFIALLVSSALVAEEHLPVSGKSYTIGNGSATDWTHKYETLSFAGIPDKLSFNFAYIYQVQAKIGNPTLSYDQLSDLAKFFLGIGNYSDTRKGVGNTHMLYVEESADGQTWTTVWTDDDATNMDTHSSGEIQLSRSTRHIRFHHSCNFSNSYTNIAISELKYVENPEPASIDFGTAVINTGEVSATTHINWCNIAPMTVSSSNSRFSVTPSGFGEYEKYGTQQLTIRFTHNNIVGKQEANITISNGNAAYNKTIHVTANTTKRKQTIAWNPQLAATGFAMNVGEQFPDAQIATVATVQSGEKVVFTSSNSNIIEVIADTALLAKSVGTVNITAYQAGGSEYDEASDTKSFTVTGLLKQYIVWDQPLYTLLTTSAPVQLTATASGGGAITYTSDDESVVRIDGNTLTVVGEGETFITAHQAGGIIAGQEYLQVSAKNYVIVRNPASQCNGIALSQNSLTLNGSHKSQDYNLNGIPATLTFTAKHGTKSTSSWGEATYSALIVEQYAEINELWDWYKVYEQVVGTGDTPSGNITLDESATKVRFRTLETGTDHTINNVRVTRKKFMRTDVGAVDMNIEANATWTKTITVSHSNIDLMTVVAKQGLISLSTSTLGDGCEDFGDDAFVASFTPMQKYVDYYDTIVITDGKAQPSTIEIPVHFYTRGLTQSIVDFSLPETALATDKIRFSATATSGMDVVYLSSDSTIAYVENDSLIILRSGTVAITAYQAGNDRYNSAGQTKTVVIQPVPVVITALPVASNISIGHPLGDSRLTGGEASVEGEFAWANPDILPELGTTAYDVIFTPVNAAIYAVTALQVEVTVQEEEIPAPTTYGEFAASICEGDSVAFAGVWYKEATETDVLLEELNTYGGDSIVHLTVTSHPVYLFEDSLTVHQRMPDIWQDVALGQLPLGDTTLMVRYATAEGCDSVYTLYLTVLPMITTYGNDTIRLCAGERAEYEGKTYRRPTKDSVLVSQPNQYGGDSIVELVVYVFPAMRFSAEMTIREKDNQTWQGYDLSLMPLGDTTLVATYTSTHGCDSTLTLYLTVLPRITTYGNDTIRLCAGERAEYEGKTYRRPTKDSILLSQPNQYGCDSIVELVVYVFPAMRFSAEMTIREKDNQTWQGYDLSLMPLGDTTLVATYTSVNGCDSTFTLYLTVLPRITTYGNDTIRFCAGGQIEYEGVTYNRPTKDTVLLSQPNQYGCDSIVELVVYMSPVMQITAEQTITEGDSLSWQGYDLSLMPIGDTTLVSAYTSIYGCDSTYTLYLSVLPKVTTYGNDTIRLCEGEQAEYEDRIYNGPAKDSILLSQPNQYGGDSIVELVVYVFPVVSVELTDTITEGDSLSWQGYDLSLMPVGDTTLVATYTSAYGCDSTLTLYLTVLPNMKEAIDQTEWMQRQRIEKIFRNGQFYIRRENQLFDLTGRKVKEER